MGYVEDQNVVIEYRWAENQYDRLPALAADLAGRQVGVIAAIGSAPAAMAAKAAAPTIPMVFGTGADPVEAGLVKSFNRPGGNATGFLFVTRLLVQKQFEILHTLLPNAQEIAVLVNPTNRPEEQIRDVSRAATVLGQKIIVLRASTDAEIDAAFLTFVQQRVGALHVPGDAFLWERRDKLVALAERNAIPAIYAQREFVDIGGLMSYGASCRRDQPAQDALAPFRLEVEHDTALVAVHHQKGADLRRDHVARVIAVWRLFDFDDFGAHIRQH
jgi:putative ABC transport system substrate-binding protein